ncbi:MAG: diguanylate cyclase [Candidatus Aminicenantes bacterium]|nr:diguanylate cyclase [Candidatus Aminicenantes bacterium]
MDTSQTSSTVFFENLIEHLHDAIIFLDTDKKILLWNRGAEETSGFLKPEIIGKKCFENILIQSDGGVLKVCKTSCPVEKTFRDGQERIYDAYLQHKEGFRLPVTLHVLPIFDRERNVIGAVETFHDTSPKIIIPQKMEELKRMNLLDPHTELANRKYLEIQLKLRLEEMNRHKLPLGILLVDIDHFSKFNEVHGKEVGDKVLRMVSRTLSNNIRFFDVIGYWEGGRFLILVFNINESKLDLVANKLRLLVSQSSIQIEAKLLGVTVSIGAAVALLRDNSASLICKTENLLKTSKKHGGNRVSSRIME